MINNNIHNVPQLRFTEFSEDWKEKKYNNFYSFKTTNSYSRDKLNYESGDVKNIHYGDIHTKFKSLFNIKNEFVPFINDDINISKIPDDCYLKEGDLIIADASENYNDIGKTIEIQNLNNEKVVAGLHTFLARRESDDMANGFASFLMKTHKVRLEVMKIAQGTKVLGISKFRLEKIPLFVPTPTEQTKIATFLTAVDKRINLLQKKKAELEQYKKGIMQQLFSQDIRFKKEDGSDFEDWEEKKLGDLLLHISKRNKDKRIQKVLSVSNTRGFILQKEQFEKHRVASKDVSNYKIVENGDFAYNPSRINVGSIAKLKTEEIGIVSPMYVVFRTKKELNSTFFEYMTHLHMFNYFVKIGCSGSVRDSLNFTNMELFKFKIPLISEQQKIATFLSSIDKSIDNMTNQIDDSVLFKKGLLQKMFV